MRTDIEFDAEGTTLRGWFYKPDSSPGPAPVIVMAPGYAGVKEQRLDRVAEIFAAAGLASVVYDHRNFGASDGLPRQEIDPWAQIRDYRHAITFAQTQAAVDPKRVGIWGSSYSGGHVLVVGAIDRRVRCVVSQVPTISGHQSHLRRVPAQLVPELLARFDADRAARFRGEAPAHVPIVSEDENEQVKLLNAETLVFLRATDADAPAFQRQVTLRSLEMAREYEPGIYVSRISPTPLLMVVAREDKLTPTDLALDAYARALEPKKLVFLPGGHYGCYLEEIDRASIAERDFFVEHLR